MNNKCQIASHNQKKIITICLATQCQGNRVCCQMCQVEFHKDHIEKLLDLDSLIEFIKSQGQKQDVISPNVAQMLEKLNNVQKNVETLIKLIVCEMQRLSSTNLQQYCRNIGNQYNIDTEKLENQQWNQLAQDMLSQVEITNGELIEKSSDVNQLGQHHQLFMEQFSQQITKINNEFQIFQQITDPSQFMQLTVPYLLDSHTDKVTGIDICEARNLLVSASLDGTVKLWDLQNFELLKTYKDTNMLYDVVFSNNGNQIAYCGRSEIISLIDISDLNKQDLVQELKGHSYQINRIIFSLNSIYLISGSDDDTVRVWDVKSTLELFKFNTKGPVCGVTINNDNSLIASIQDNGEINIWNFKDQQLLFIQEMNCEGRAIQFSNEILVSCGNNGVIKIWSLTEQLNQGKLSLIREIQTSDNEIYSISLTSDSRFIISHCNDEKQVKVMDSFTGKLVKQYEVKGRNRYCFQNIKSWGDVAITRKLDMLTYSDGNSIAVWKN